MMEVADQIAGMVQTWLAEGLVVFLRVGAAIAVLPAVGERFLPQRIRLIIAIWITVVVVPAVSAYTELLAPYRGGSSMVYLTEPIIGLAIGISVRLFVLGLETAASMAAQAMSLSQIFAGAADNPMPALGHVLMFAGLALAVTLGLPVKLVALLVQTYEVFPPGRLPEAGLLTDWGILRVSSVFALAFTLAAPFLIASMVYNLALGIINRAMPQLMVAFVGAPAITAGALILSMLSATMLLRIWAQDLFKFIDWPFQVF